eukprot:3045582-Pleurochrysis_carterae.AAC.1
MRLCFACFRAADGACGVVCFERFVSPAGGGFSGVLARLCDGFSGSTTGGCATGQESCQSEFGCVSFPLRVWRLNSLRANA